MNDNPMHWGALEDPEENARVTQAEIARQNKELAIYYAKCFDTDFGKKVLEHLEKTYLEQPVADPNLGSEFAYYREGSNNVIRVIKGLIETGKAK